MSFYSSMSVLAFFQFSIELVLLLLDQSNWGVFLTIFHFGNNISEFAVS